MQYETVIGLETHVQLNTRSKAFCSDPAAFGGAPNAHTSWISLAHPGTLPRLNKAQVEKGVRLGLALGSEIPLRNEFDRKNYFYTDLPKGYQITQDRHPICIGGQLPIRWKSGEKKVRIHHIHMEEDAGKSLHHLSKEHSLIDLNRAGVPLLEVVSEPDLRSPDEVDAFMSAMRQLVRYLGISDGNMEEGSLRCDVNVSVRPVGSETYGTRCEIKNLNSMRFARQAINYEVKRQISILESGGSIQQQTLHFNPETGETSPLREKEEAHDYRYFPEPDLPPIVLKAEWLEKEKEQLPPLPWELFQKLQETYGLSEYDAELISNELETCQYYENLVQDCQLPKKAANLIINKILPVVQQEEIRLKDFPIPISSLTELLKLIEGDHISNTAANQTLFPLLLENPGLAPIKLAEQANIVQIKDQSYLSVLADQVLAEFPEKVEAYKKGKKGLLGFFMGALMRASKGKADPKQANSILKEKLGD